MFNILYRAIIVNKINIFSIIILFFSAILLGCNDNNGFIDKPLSNKELSAYPQIFVLKQGQTQKIDLTTSVVGKNIESWNLSQLEYNTQLGIITAQTANSFDYTTQKIGENIINYTVQSGDLTASSQIIIVVSEDVPDNHQPIANNITITTDSETPITIDLRDSISDVDGDQLQINQLTTASERFILEGYIVTYTPNGFVGLDQAVYSIDDGHGGYALAYIAVTSKDTTPTPSNSSPIAHDYSQTLDPVITPTLDINLVELNLISDPDGDTLKIARIYSGNNRVLILDDNTIRYTPGDFFGLDQFTYAIVDTSGNYALGTISVNVKNNQTQSIIKIYVEQNVFGTKINTIPAQGQANLTAAKINIDGSIVNVTNTVQWYSSDDTLLSIDKAIAYAKKEGEVNIQATLDGIDSNTITITILNDTLKYIDISPKNTTVRKYETLHFSAIAHYESGLIANITNLASWSSDNEEIASSNDIGSFMFNKDGKVIIKATFNDMTSNESAIYVQPATLESLTITAPTYSIPAGVPLQLFAEGLFSDKQKYNLSSSTKWTITEAGAGATIDNQGVFVGNTLGTITVIGSINDIVSNEININVVDAKIDSLTVSPSIVAVPQGLSMPVTLLAHYTDGTTDNNFDGVSWYSSNENIVSVDNNGNIQGLNIGVSYVYATKLGVKSNEIAIAVINAKITKIEVSPSYASISKGTKQIYKAYATYSDARQYDLTSSVVWKSNNTDIVEIGTDGIAYGHNSGEVSIKATFDGIESNSATLIIKPALLTSIELQPKHASVMVGGTINYTANGVFSDDSIDNVNTLLTWRSSDESIAKITAAGEIIGVRNGEVIINAYTTIDGKLVDSQSTLHVDATKLITNIEIGQLTDFKDINAGKVLASSSSGSDTLIKVEGITNNILTPDSSRQIYAKATYTDGSTSYITGDVVWSSSDTNIATIDHNGMVKTFSTGEVIISAQKHGIKSNNFSFSVDDITYTACPTEKVSLFINLATGGIQQLEFTCPAIMGDPNIYGNASYLPEENGFFGPNHMPVAKQPMQNDGTNNSAITYCQRLGYRLAANNELVKLWQALDGNREGVSGLYTNIGWPTLSEYWGDQKVDGEYTSIVNMVGGHILFAHDTYYTYYSCISKQSTTP